MNLRKKKAKKKPQSIIGKLWWFIWEDDSVWSWLLNVALAFLLIKFLVYPGLGLVLGTDFPVVAVVSGSMEHEDSFDEWWQSQEYVYQRYNITRGVFTEFPLSDGFNRGDIIVLKGAPAENINIGDVIVFESKRPDPIIHRVVSIKMTETGFAFVTKGDHNYLSISDSTLDETNIPASALLGGAWVRIPYLGFVKIWFVESIQYTVGLIKGER